MLLPFALIVTGCGGNLSKGSVFNEKFMKYNFGEEVKKEVSYEAPNKVELDLGDDVSSVAYADYVYQHLLKVTKSDGKFGIYDVAQGKYVVPVEDWNWSGANKYKHLTNGKHEVHIGRTEDDEGVAHFRAFDERGNEICSGEFTDENDTQLMDITGNKDKPGKIERNSREDGEYYRTFLEVGGETRCVLVFNVDGSIKEVIAADKYLEAHPYISTWGGETFAEYGNPEYVVQSKDGPNGQKYVVYNSKKNKIASQFVIPNDTFPSVATPLVIGDYFYYQRVTALHERDNKYDALISGTKCNIETYRVNYLTGKTEEVKTNLYLASLGSLTNSRNLYDKKGFYTLEYLNGVKEIRKDKSLGEARSIIVNEQLKEVADVTGITFTQTNIKPFSDGLYLASDSHVVYDKNFKEVGYFNGPTAANRVVSLVAYGGKGLIDDTGKVIFGGPAVQSIDLLSVKDHYRVQYEHKFAIVKVVDQQALVVGEYSDKDYVYSPATYGSEALIKVLDGEAKEHYLDVTTGSIIDVIAKENETDTSIATGNTYKYYGETLKLQFNVYKRTDGSCYVIRNGTNYALSYDTIK